MPVHCSRADIKISGIGIRCRFQSSMPDLLAVHKKNDLCTVLLTVDDSGKTILAPAFRFLWGTNRAHRLFVRTPDCENKMTFCINPKHIVEALARGNRGNSFFRESGGNNINHNTQ